MLRPKAKTAQEAMLDAELIELRAKARELFVLWATPQSNEYIAAATVYNESAIAKLGKENCGFILLVTK